MSDSLSDFVSSALPQGPAQPSPQTTAPSAPSPVPTAATSSAVPESDVERAVKSGEFRFPKGERVNVVNSKGESFNLPSEEAAEALKQGYSLETMKQKAIREYVAENDNLTGSAKVALKQFGNQALMGLPEVVDSHTASPFEVAKAKALKDDHEFANAVGGTAGFGASLLVGSPVFKAADAAGQLAEKVMARNLAELGIAKGSGAAKDIVSRIATNAAKYGVEGAVIQTPRAVTEAALGDPNAAAESLLAGGAFGAVLGVAGAPLGKVLETLLPKMEGGVTGKLEELRNERVAKSLGFVKSQVKKLKGGQDEAEEVGAHLFNAKLSTGTDVLAPTADATLDNVFQLRGEASQKLGSLYQQFDDAGLSTIKASKLAEEFENKLGEYYKSKLNKDETGIYENMLEALKARGKEDLSFGEAKGLLDEFAKVAYPSSKSIVVSPKQMAAQDGWHILRDSIDAAVDETVAKLGKPELKAELLAARKDYNVASRAIDPLKNKIAGEAGNKMFGLTDTIVGVGAEHSLGPLGAIGSVLAKKMGEKYGNFAAAEFLNKSIEGIQAASKFMSKMQEGLNGIPSIMKAMNRTSEAASSTSAVLTNAMGRFLGDENMPKKEAFKELQRRVSDMQANPSLMSDKISSVTTPFQQTGAPETASALNQKISNTLQYIQANIPKAQQPSNPFLKRDFEPSKADLATFERKLSVVNDPFIVFRALKDGSLTKDHMTSLAANYPLLYQAMKNRVLDHVTENESSFPYGARLKLSLMMGYDIDSSTSPESIQSYQNAFAFAAQDQNNEEKLNQSGLNKMNPAESAMTQAQRGLKA